MSIRMFILNIWCLYDFQVKSGVLHTFRLKCQNRPIEVNVTEIKFKSGVVISVVARSWLPVII